MNDADLTHAGVAGSPAELAPVAPLAGWYGVIALTLVGVVATIDRQVFVLLADPIKQSLHLSDFQLGLLQGLGVALFIALASYPFGWLADRIDRRKVLALGIVIWSVAVGVSGFSSSFLALFLSASMVAAGEAAIAPVAIALLADWFRESRRVLANAVFVMAGRLATGVAIALCGQLIVFAEAMRPHLPSWLATLETWRLTMVLAASLAPVLLLLTVSLPRGAAGHQAAARVQAQGGRAPAGNIIRFIRSRGRLFGTFYAGIGFAVFSFAAIAAWLPVSASRLFKATPGELGAAFGVASTVSVLAGLAFMAVAPRWLGPRLGVRMPIRILMGVSALAWAPVALMPLATDLTALFVLMAAFMSIVMVGAMVFVTAIQDLSPRPMLARLVALSTVTQSVFGALAPPVVGWLSDQLPGPGGLLQAMVGASVASFAASTWVLWLCSREYEAGVQAARAHDYH